MPLARQGPMCRTFATLVRGQMRVDIMGITRIQAPARVVLVRVSVPAVAEGNKGPPQSPPLA